MSSSHHHALSKGVNIHELNSKLRTIDTARKRLKTEFDALKTRGVEVLTRFSNELLRLENTKKFCLQHSCRGAATALFPTKEENETFARRAIRKRRERLAEARRLIDPCLDVALCELSSRFQTLLATCESDDFLCLLDDDEVSSRLCFPADFNRRTIAFLKVRVSELDAKRAVVSHILSFRFAEEAHSEEEEHVEEVQEVEESEKPRDVLLVALVSWILDPFLPDDSDDDEQEPQKCYS